MKHARNLFAVIFLILGILVFATVLLFCTEKPIIVNIYEPARIAVPMPEVTKFRWAPTAL